MSKVLARDINWPESLDPECRDLIEQLLQVKPEDRLGAMYTKHDMNALMNHPFFEDIDFYQDLSRLGVKELLLETESAEEEKVEEYEAPIPLNTENSAEAKARKYLEEKYGPLEPNKPILTGLLFKRNPYGFKQERTFALYLNGQLKYY